MNDKYNVLPEPNMSPSQSPKNDFSVDPELRKRFNEAMSKRRTRKSILIPEVKDRNNYNISIKETKIINGNFTCVVTAENIAGSRYDAFGITNVLTPKEMDSCINQTRIEAIEKLQEMENKQLFDLIITPRSINFFTALTELNEYEQKALLRFAEQQGAQRKQRMEEPGFDLEKGIERATEIVEKARQSSNQSESLGNK